MRDLQPEEILRSIDKVELSPCYLFFGPDEFTMEKVVSSIRERYIPESARDYNLDICYGGETNPSEIVNMAQAVPFTAKNRLIIVRRTEEFKAEQLERFLPYLNNPVRSTCLIFMSGKTDFRKNFYNKFRNEGCAVDFKELKPGQIGAWIRKTAREMGLNISPQACIYLQEITGDRLRDLYSELTKINIRYGDAEIGEKEIRELAVNGRTYDIFKLMDAISIKDVCKSLSILSSFLEEEDKKAAPLQIIGMLNRQISLLWKTKAIVDGGGRPEDAVSKLGIQPFQAGNFVKHSRHWSHEELEKGISLLYRSDRLLKLGLRPGPVLEGLVLGLCGYLGES
ncbi:MAG: DNA polymerase III subunit delta [Deltaproteobacteria bacterium]|nr:DNA polymerase III subunit delta [Deltaproteobacteria bacterium]